MVQQVCLLAALLTLLGLPTLASTPIAYAGEPRAAATLVFPANFMTSVKDYGAKGDGVSDDSDAIQRALNDERVDPLTGNSLHDDYFGRPKALYFPAGVYLVSKPLNWIGCCVTLQGAGRAATVIRLKDSTAGFDDPTRPQALIRTPEGNMSFRQNVWELTIDTGSGNPGAVGLDYIANNSGAVRGVTIRSQDRHGVAGLALNRTWPGPCLLKDLEVVGFDYGIDVATPEYGSTFEQIRLQDQRIAGIRNDGNTLAIRTISSQNTVPAILSLKDWSSLIVLDGNFGGGSSTASAIDSAGYLYARNIASQGYRSAIRDNGTVVPGATQAEYLAGQVHKLFAESPSRSLNLAVRETPSFHDDDLNQWARFVPRNYGDTSGLQALFDSGKSTVYFPFGGYFSYDERVVMVPASVRRIIGFSSIVNGDGQGRNGGGIRLIVEANSSQPLIIEQFGYGIKVEHRGSRTVVLKHGGYVYSAAAGAGDLFLEDVELGPLKIQAGQHVWARQLNNEYGGTKIVNSGGDLWILGLKTERTGTVIETVAGGRSELLGTLIYPAAEFSAAEKQQPAFRSREASMSLIYSVSAYGANNIRNYDIQVEETRGGVTRRLLTTSFTGRMPLYAGFRAQSGMRVLLPLVQFGRVGPAVMYYTGSYTSRFQRVGGRQIATNSAVLKTTLKARQ